MVKQGVHESRKTTSSRLLTRAFLKYYWQQYFRNVYIQAHKNKQLNTMFWWHQPPPCVKREQWSRPLWSRALVAVLGHLLGHNCCFKTHQYSQLSELEMWFNNDTPHSGGVRFLQKECEYLSKTVRTIWYSTANWKWNRKLKSTLCFNQFGRLQVLQQQGK